MIEERAKAGALVLAGSRPGEPDTVAREAGVPFKAFAPVAGRPMVERVLEVLLSHPAIDSIELALPGAATPEVHAPRLAQWLDRGSLRRVNAASSPARTVAEALDRSPDGPRLLVTTADHALLSIAVLDQFLSRCGSSDADVFVGFVPLELVKARYPNTKRTSLKFRDGRFKSCNLFLLRNGPGPASLVWYWLRLEALRKQPWRMALAIGPAALLAYGLRLRSLGATLDGIGKRTGTRIAAAMLDAPEAAIDVDSPQDLRFADRLLRAADRHRRQGTE